MKKLPQTLLNYLVDRCSKFDSSSLTNNLVSETIHDPYLNSIERSKSCIKIETNYCDDAFTISCVKSIRIMNRFASTCTSERIVGPIIIRLQKVQLVNTLMEKNGSSYIAEIELSKDSIAISNWYPNVDMHQSGCYMLRLAYDNKYSLLFLELLRIEPHLESKNAIIAAYRLGPDYTICKIDSVNESSNILVI